MSTIEIMVPDVSIAAALSFRGILPHSLSTTSGSAITYRLTRDQARIATLVLLKAIAFAPCSRSDLADTCVELWTWAGEE